jgi:hypothetical protein
MATPAVMKGVFPEALLTLQEADPEVFNIIEDEKARQWYVFVKRDCVSLGFGLVWRVTYRNVQTQGPLVAAAWASGVHVGAQVVQSIT